MSGERKGERASARSTISACIDGALSWDKRSLQSAQYGAGSSGLQNASIKTGIALNSEEAIESLDLTEGQSATSEEIRSNVGREEGG